MASHRIGVFPASGGIGAAGATVRKADYDTNADLEHPFEDIDTLFLILYASIEVEHRAEHHRTAIDFAICAGVEYIFYGSLGFAGREDNKETVAHLMRPHLMRPHLMTRSISKSASASTPSLRTQLYVKAFTPNVTILYTAFFEPCNPVDEIKIEHDLSGPGIAWVKREELGEGTAELLRRFAENPKEFKFRNKTVLLSGIKVLILQETVDIRAKHAKKPVAIRQVSDEEFGKQPKVAPNFTYRGVDYGTAWASSFEAFRRGEASAASTLLRELLGREPEDFETTISSQL
ncbi:hypothetical protein N7522_010623 [Penicillium canescens]|nr:hypothetical protein N7522_010623 [Penicillium canescens]